MTISNALLEGETHIQDISRQEGRGDKTLRFFGECYLWMAP